VNETKIKIGQRIVRAVAAGLALFAIFYVIGNILVTACNSIAGSTVLDATGIPLLLGGMALFSAVATEISKDFEATE